MKSKRSMSMTITFPKYDSEIYEFLQEEPNASALIRDLVRDFMIEQGEPISTRRRVKRKTKTSNIIDEAEEKKESKNNTKHETEANGKDDFEEIQTQKIKNNRNRIKQMPDL